MANPRFSEEVVILASYILHTAASSQAGVIEPTAETLYVFLGDSGLSVSLDACRDFIAFARDGGLNLFMRDSFMSYARTASMQPDVDFIILRRAGFPCPETIGFHQTDVQYEQVHDVLPVHEYESHSDFIRFLVEEDEQNQQEIMSQISEDTEEQKIQD